MRRKPADLRNAENDKDSAASACVEMKLNWTDLSEQEEESGC